MRKLQVMRMSERGENAAQPGFLFVGNNLCLDFINTLRLRDGHKLDLLRGVDDLLAWCVDAGIVDRAQGAALVDHARGRREAEAVFGQAIELRAALFDMAQALARGKPVAPRIVGLINVILEAWQGSVELVRSKRGYSKQLRRAFTRPIHLLAPIAESAADLLSSGDAGLVKKCQASDCLIYFYDATKNHSRTWCSMEVCGNRAKAAAHYQRKRHRAA